MPAHISSYQLTSLGFNLKSIRFSGAALLARVRRVRKRERVGSSFEPLKFIEFSLNSEAGNEIEENKKKLQSETTVTQQLNRRLSLSEPRKWKESERKTNRPPQDQWMVLKSIGGRCRQQSYFWAASDSKRETGI